MSASKGSAMFHKLKVGPMKKLYKYCTPQTISLAGGVPMERIFPFATANIELRDQSKFTVSSGSSLHLNYSRGDGVPALRDWIQNHIKSLHQPVVESSSCMTVSDLIRSY